MNEEEDILKFLDQIKEFRKEIAITQNNINNKVGNYLSRLAKESNMEKLLEVFQKDFSVSRSKESLLAKSMIDTLGWEKGVEITLKIILCTIPEFCKCTYCEKNIKNILLCDNFSEDDIKYFSSRGLRITSQYRVKIPHAWSLHLFCCEECRDKYTKLEQEKEKENEERRLKFKSKFENNSSKGEALEQLKNMPYLDYLQTDHWKNIRKRAYAKANYRCELCYSNLDLQVHHKTYERRGEEYLSDLIVLCEDCHKRHHNIKDKT